ncbi:hypothetical protein GH714_040285 [Hevea brasiliensis]|uniref:Chloride conductance regulatory protein ICln n=1 Tax=Hevea brasiliensis TaxID=3981 RepID=A0A6A6MTK2_HEVBR|nr:hypothetical protein GH714_040285 [Hevea brasiliensis]
MVRGLRQFAERRGDGAGEPVLNTDNGEEIMHVQPSVAIVIGNRSPESPGTLYISTKKVVWLSDVDRAKIETEDDGDESDNSDAENNDVLDLSKVTEMRLVPSDPSQLDNLFQIFCECAELNPEPVDEDVEEGNNWVFSTDQMADDAADEEDSEWHFSQNPTSSIGHSNGDHDVARRVLELQINDQRFEDPEETEQDSDSGH